MFSPIREKFHAFAADESGTTAIEYGIIAVVISVAIVGTVVTLGSSIKTQLFDQAVNTLGSLPN